MLAPGFNLGHQSVVFCFLVQEALQNGDLLSGVRESGKEIREANIAWMTGRGSLLISLSLMNKTTSLVPGNYLIKATTGKGEI